jgi:sorbitol-specific phosphotransferase system component IIA
MAVNIKIFSLEELGHIVIYFRVNENRPYDGFFSFTVMWNTRSGGGGSFFSS